jgi:hypothetical protein
MQYVKCPHTLCGITIQIVALNCAIFRCGVFKATGRQVDPHLPKRECDALIASGLIYGCGGPFRVYPTETGAFESVVCDYI